MMGCGLAFLLLNLINPISKSGFYDSASPVMEGIIDFHHELFFYLIVILVFVSWFLARIMVTYTNIFNKNLLHINKIPQNQLLEILWTLFPAILLSFLAILSFTLLYATQEIIYAHITIKVIGHQWYWSYEYYNPIETYKLIVVN
jgi:cytochrome c oxidase subunit 2